MNISIPPSVDFLTGRIESDSKVTKATTIKSLEGVFADTRAYSQLDPDQVVYSVEMLPAESDEGELNFGVSHIEPGLVGNEYHMTRGHFHQREEQAEYYFGAAGKGLLILQDQSGGVTVESVFPGSVHHIGGYIAHRLVNTGEVRLSALAVWPAVAGHNYGELKEKGFNVRVLCEDGDVRLVNQDD
ncbi:glucose-6-phosphate isomerase family protein [Vibrio sp. 99-8-1]|uniref:glucose-6-phosphate isomerase family protein n=1 Tax=Vibrio sp. 99-8-1 TaxID=2607602 RepID=UPI001493CCA3|nr:glucose-6-phosphate isomerase family protein [Vibrio sp. 99-8-1]NOI65356.1 glucose-6-phosphate isomerase [Vibrio sp. 99-8-1]